MNTIITQSIGIAIIVIVALIVWIVGSYRIYEPSAKQIAEIDYDLRAFISAPKHVTINSETDTAPERHLKNLCNGVPDEQWVVDELEG